MQASEPDSNSKDRDGIEAQAARLLARLKSAPSPADEAEIYAWIDADPRHAVAFARAEMGWEAAERLKSSAANISLPPPEAVISEEVQRRITRNVLIATVIAVLLFIVAAIVTIRIFNGVDRHETAIGQMRNITLADGSVLHLNSDSEAEVRFTDNGRKVRILRGEASFDVARDPTRPFEVEVRSAVIRAVGTAFNVRMRTALVELTVTHGSVSVRCGAGALRQVPAGTGAIIQPRAIALTSLGPSLVGQRIAWRERMVDLDGQTVEQAASEFNRYRKAPILIGDTRVSALRIIGRFRTSDSRQFLETLQQNLPVRAINGEDGSVMLLYRDSVDKDGSII